MKKIKLLSLSTLFLTSSLLIAQSADKKTNLYATASDGGKCFDENTHVLNVGIGFGGGNYYHYGRGFGYTYRSSPAFSLTYEQAYKKPLGPGYLGIGAYLGYQTAYYQFNNYYYNGGTYYYRNRWNFMVLAARGAYHLDLLNTNNAELYFGAILGIRYAAHKFESNSPDPNIHYYEASYSSIAPTGSLFVGGRWYFVPKVALFGEVGYGISYLTAGLSFKF